MSWTHPDDVPTSLTRRAYAMRGTRVSQNDYAAVVADAFEDVAAEYLRTVSERAQEALGYQGDENQQTEATVAAARVLELPWETVADVLNVFTHEASRIAREQRARRHKEQQA